jgi:hypothetical protein
MRMAEIDSMESRQRALLHLPPEAARQETRTVTANAVMVPQGCRDQARLPP